MSQYKSKSYMTQSIISPLHTTEGWKGLLLNGCYFLTKTCLYVTGTIIACAFLLLILLVILPVGLLLLLIGLAIQLNRLKEHLRVMTLRSIAASQKNCTSSTVTNLNDVEEQCPGSLFLQAKQLGKEVEVSTRVERLRDKAGGN